MPMRPTDRVNRTVLIAILILLVLGALRLTASVAVPLASSLFLIGLFWPLYDALEARTRPIVALLGTLLSFALIIAAFVAGLWYSAHETIRHIQQNEDVLVEQYRAIRADMADLGISLPGAAGDGAQDDAEGGGLGRIAARVSQALATFLGAATLTVAFFLIGILEVRLFRDKLRTAFGRERSARWLDSFRSITGQFQRFFVGRTVVGLLTGLAVGLISVLVGLDLAFLWGFTNFLLNYIPIIGSIVAVIPPTLFALVQYEDPKMALIALAAVGGVQAIMGSFVDPQVQGRFVSISPMAVLISVALWGWLWGIAGAFLAVPIVIAVAIATAHFPQTRWIGTLLTRTLQAPPARSDEARSSD